MKTGILPDRIRDVSEAVYRLLLEQDGTRANKATGELGDVARMIAKDGDQGQKLRGRAASYDRLTRVYMQALRVT